MMTINKIIDYVLKTPGNTNPNVLRGMLKALQTGDNPDLSIITATAEDIKTGKVSVDVEGNKVEGSFVPLDTSDADATAADIASGKTAYVNGVKITGEAIIG